MILIVMFAINACVRVNLHGLTSGYRKEILKTSIVFTDDLTKMNAFDSKIIYTVNGNTLRNKLENYDNALVYFWSPFCSGTSCISLDAAQRICDEKKLELFVVADCYDNNIPYFNAKTKNPILAMDHQYYKSNLAQKVENRFTEDLIQIQDTIITFRFLHFSNGKYTTARINLQEF